MAKAEVGLLVALAALMLLLGAGVSSMYFVSNPVEVEKPVPFPVPGEKEILIVNITEYLPSEPVVITEIVEVEDVSKLKLVEEFVKDNIDKDLTIEYVLFESESRKLGEEFISANMINLLVQEKFFDSVLDDYRKSEVSIYRIYKPSIVSKDYKDLDIELRYEVKVRAKRADRDREYFEFEVTLPFENKVLIEEEILVIEK
jgi:hypothetical protein